MIIGLVISKQMIDLLGESHVDVDSKEGEGTTISFEIHDKYSPMGTRNANSVSEFAAEGITSAIFYQSNHLNTEVVFGSNQAARNNSNVLNCAGLQANSRNYPQFSPSSQVDFPSSSFHHEMDSNNLMSESRDRTILLEKDSIDQSAPIFILLDDEKLNLFLLRKLIKKLKPVSDIQEFFAPGPCLDFLKKRPRETQIVLFTDIELNSSMDGFELAQKANELFPSIKAISYSSHEKDFISSQSQYFHAFLAKPFKEEDLLSVFSTIGVL